MIRDRDLVKGAETKQGKTLGGGGGGGGGL